MNALGSVFATVNRMSTQVPAARVFFVATFLLSRPRNSLYKSPRGVKRVASANNHFSFSDGCMATLDLRLGSTYSLTRYTLVTN